MRSWFLIPLLLILSFSLAMAEAQQNSSDDLLSETENTVSLREELPLLEDLPWPEVETLLNEEPRDWIILIGGKVLTVPALWPRPDYLANLVERQKQFAQTRPTDPAALNPWLEKYKQFNYLKVEVPEQGIEQNFQLHIRYIDRILYHEDLALKKAGELLQTGDILSTQRLIMAVARWEHQHNQRRQQEQLAPITWPELLESQRELLVAQVEQAQQAGEWEQAFRWIKFHHQADSKFHALSQLASTSFSVIAEQAEAQQDFRKVRYFLNQMQADYPGAAVITTWKDRLNQKAETQLQLAEEAARNGDPRKAALWAQRAIAIWPHSSGLQRRASPLIEKYQVLRVGILQDDPLREVTHHQLLDHVWLQVESWKEGYPRYRSRFIEAWLPDDLGKQVTFQLKLSKQNQESQPELTSRHLAAALSQASLGTDPRQQGLFATGIERIEIIAPHQCQVQFKQSPPHPLNWCAALLSQSSGLKNSPLLNQLFKPFDPSEVLEPIPPQTRYVRAFPESSSSRRPGIAEVQEFVFTQPEELLQSLLRDELDYLPALPPVYAEQLQNDVRFLVHQLIVPENWWLQFHLQGRLKSQPELRLALLSMLDRGELLAALSEQEGIAPAHVRLTETFVSRKSHAWTDSTEVVTYDPIAGRALAQILLRNPQAPRQLRLLLPGAAEAHRVGQLVKTQWEALGIEVQLLEESALNSQLSGSGQSSAGWDVCLKVDSLLSPLSQLPAHLSESGQVTLVDLKQMPAAMRHSLLELENASDWNAVNRTLHRLQEQLTIDAWALPLWERDRFAARRRELQQAPYNSWQPYYAIDLWRLSPVFPGF